MGVVVIYSVAILFTAALLWFFSDLPVRLAHSIVRMGGLITRPFFSIVLYLILASIPFTLYYLASKVLELKYASQLGLLLGVIYVIAVSGFEFHLMKCRYRTDNDEQYK